jgi:hypothetical protein
MEVGEKDLPIHKAQSLFRKYLQFALAKGIPLLHEASALRQQPSTLITGMET